MKLLKFVPHSESHVIQLISNLVEKVKGRKKLIRIADTSTGGWTTVRKYESNVIASDSEDEPNIRQADARAVRIIKNKWRNRAHPYKASAKSAAMETAPNPYYASNYKRQDMPLFRAGNGRRKPSIWDMCHAGRQTGHWRGECPLLKMHQQINSASSIQK
jgi:hypothetical protein